MSRYHRKSTAPELDPKLEIKQSMLSEARNFFNLSKVRKIVRLGAEIFGAVQPFMEKPTWWSAAKCAFGVGKAVVDDVEAWSDDYFSSDDWIQPYSRDFNQTLLPVLSKFPYQMLKMSDDNNFIRLVDMNGAKVGWVFNTKINTVENIYVEASKAKEARETIKRLLWEQFKGEPLVMRQNKRMIVGTDEAKIVFEVDDAFHPMPSLKATEYSQYLKRCLDAGVPRSVMLYGPPGTGKSTMARTLIEKLQLRSFRIRIEDVGGLENSTLFEAISIFEPDAVILDDFDRAHAQASLLETLEFFQRHVKLVVATVNNKNDLDEALLRPGRFDELVFIDKMDEGVVKMMLGEFVDGFDVVKDWPIAFVQEYVKRRKFMSKEEAAEATKELARRVNRLSHYRDDDDDRVLSDDETTRMIKIVGSGKKPRRRIIVEAVALKNDDKPVAAATSLDETAEKHDDDEEAADETPDGAQDP